MMCTPTSKAEVVCLWACTQQGMYGCSQGKSRLHEKDSGDTHHRFYFAQR